MLHEVTVHCMVLLILHQITSDNTILIYIYLCIKRMPAEGMSAWSVWGLGDSGFRIRAGFRVSV